MATFDFHIHPVVGTLSINESSGHGYVKVYGYMDGIDFHRLSDSEAESIFAPNGEVFAANIQRNHYGKNNSLVSLYVMENTREGGKNAFVWDWKGDVELVGVRIVQLDKELNDNGQANYKILEENSLLGKEDDTYILSGDKLYYIKAGSDSRLIPFSFFSESLPIIKRNSYYYLGYGLPSIDGSIDITTNEQLVEWFLKVIKTHWEDIQKGTGKASLEAAKEALVSMKSLPVSVVESRLNRLVNMTDSYTFTRDHLKLIASAPWFQPSLDASLARFKEDYIDTVLGENKEEIERIQSEHQALLNEEITKHNRKVVEFHEKRDKIEAELQRQIEASKQELQDTQVELEKAKANVEQAKGAFEEIQSSISKIEERKSQILEDFQVVRDVLKLSGSGNNALSSSTEPKYNLQYNCLSDKKLPLYNAFEKNLENCLKLYHVKGISVSELARIHAHYAVMLLPNIQVASSVVLSAGRSWSYTVFVSVAWKSFEDLWRAGLGSVVNHCIDEPDTIHYLILRNINLTSLSNYLQPLADLQGRFTSTFPGTDKPFPANLRVLLTVSDEELLPMPESILRFFGCITRDIEVESWAPVVVKDATVYGYIDSKLLANASGDTNDAPNYYQDYIDE